MNVTFQLDAVAADSLHCVGGWLLIDPKRRNLNDDVNS